MNANQLVVIHDRQAVTTSQILAQYFGKQHAEVIKTIRRIFDQTAPELRLGYFHETSYADTQGRLQPAFELTRKGFSLVGMSFTGERAFQFKIEYIEAFERMEEALRQQSQSKLLETLDQAYDIESKLQDQVTSLKDELLDTYRTQVKLLGKAPKRKVTVNRPVTPEVMQQIRDLAAQGMTSDAIAQKLGRSRATVFYALQGAMGTTAAPKQSPLFTEGV
jgi:Rha family phage regulatory protein